MRVRLSKPSLEWLGDHRILLRSKGGERLRPGDALSFADDCEVEPYIGVFAGAALCPMGFQSITNSALSTKLRMGRYCSIAHDVDAHLTPHALDHVSTFAGEPEEALVRLFIEDDGGAGPDRGGPARYQG